MGLILLRPARNPTLYYNLLNRTKMGNSTPERNRPVESEPPPQGIRSAIILPARLASTRLPGKLLLAETGKTVLQHTYEAASRALLPSQICVAADGEEIAAAVIAFGGKVVRTDPDAASGTDRIAELAADMPDVDIIVNVQADEPEITGEAIDRAITLLQQNLDVPMSTLATPLRSPDQLSDPACVKVVLDARGRALYFSRSPIPHDRERGQAALIDSPAYLQHVGLYAYRREFLLQIPHLPPSPLEELEKLEQLRVLSAGHAILVGIIDEPTIGIDTPEDYRAFVERASRR